MMLLLETAQTATPEAWDVDFSDYVPEFPKRRKLMLELRKEYDRHSNYA